MGLGAVCHTLNPRCGKLCLTLIVYNVERLSCMMHDACVHLTCMYLACWQYVRPSLQCITPLRLAHEPALMQRNKLYNLAFGAACAGLCLISICLQAV